ATLVGCGIPYRLLHGRSGVGSKMHHKFVVLDGQTVASGSYNWTMESEERNHENLIVLRAPELATAYVMEFESLWNKGGPPVSSPAS
ncbi:MAG TPA: phospholipase D-like domain-containing protein, partial [Terriglobia bacterium]